MLELKLCLTMWEHYQQVIGELDRAIAAQLCQMKTKSDLPPLPPKPRVRGRKPHDPGFDVRTALYYLTGVDLTRAKLVGADFTGATLTDATLDGAEIHQAIFKGAVGMQTVRGLETAEGRDVAVFDQ